jgi:hypothetical protein
MGVNRRDALGAAACLVLLTAAGCGREDQDEMSWARAALERNGRVEVVAADQSRRTFTVRFKDTGEVRVVRADQMVADLAPGTPVAGNASIAAPSASAAGAPALAAAEADQHAAVATPGEAATPEESSRPPPLASVPAAAPAASPGGRVLKTGPGYSIEAASAGAPASAGRVREAAVTSAALERRHEPIVCQGARLLHIDNRNLEFDGDAVSAEDGCEIHITNSHIVATGVGVSARAANVHIDNSLIEGGTASIDASEGAQVYAASSRFRGLSRRVDTAAFHDLGGNIWN